MELTWEEPQGRVWSKKGDEVSDLAVQLRRNPGRWAKVDRGRSFANNVQGGSYPLLPPSEFEATQRTIDGVVWCFIRARVEAATASQPPLQEPPPGR